MEGYSQYHLLFTNDTARTIRFDEIRKTTARTTSFRRVLSILKASWQEFQEQPPESRVATRAVLLAQLVQTLEITRQPEEAIEIHYGDQVLIKPNWVKGCHIFMGSVFLVYFPPQPDAIVGLLRQSRRATKYSAQLQINYADFETVQALEDRVISGLEHAILELTLPCEESKR